jgi:hypothetical protein
VNVRRPRRSVVIAAGVIAVVASIAATVVVVRTGASGEQEPLAPDSGFLMINSIPVAVGVPSTVGIFLPESRHIDPVRLLRVQMVMADPGIRLVGARVLWANENHGGFLGGAVGFPPSGYRTHPLQGTTVNTRTLPDLSIIVGLTATEPGVHNIGSFVVTYRAGSRIYHALIYHAVTLCAPVDKERSCQSRPGASKLYNNPANVLARVQHEGIDLLLAGARPT